MATLSTTRVPTSRVWTAEDLLRLPEDQRCELIDGELLFMAPAGDEHGLIGSSIHYLITHHARQHTLGRTYTSETGFILKRDPDRVRSPDVAFVRTDRVRRGKEGFFPGAPDLAVEVVSPDDREADVLEKVNHYLEAGTQLVWVAWPRTRSVTVHTAGAQPLILHEGDTLDGGNVLPGFACDVRQIFE